MSTKPKTATKCDCSQRIPILERERDDAASQVEILLGRLKFALGLAAELAGERHEVLQEERNAVDAKVDALLGQMDEISAYQDDLW